MTSTMHFPEGIDSTMLSAFDACPQKFFVEFILRRMPIGRSIHLHAGGCMASAFEKVRRLFYKEKLPLEECLFEAYKSFVAEWGDIEPPEREYKDFVNCWAAVEQYFKHYHPRS